MSEAIYYEISTAKRDDHWTVEELRGAGKEEASKAFEEHKKDVQDDQGYRLELWECHEKDGGITSDLVAEYDYYSDLCDRMEELDYPNTAEYYRTHRARKPYYKPSTLRWVVAEMERGDYGDDD